VDEPEVAAAPPNMPVPTLLVPALGECTAEGPAIDGEEGAEEELDPDELPDENDSELTVLVGRLGGNSTGDGVITRGVLSRVEGDRTLRCSLKLASGVDDDIRGAENDGVSERSGGLVSGGLGVEKLTRGTV